MDLQDVRKALTRHSSEFIEAYVYGSVLTDSSDQYSDVDLVLVRFTKLPFFDRIREIMSLRREFGSLDLLIYTPDELAAILAEPGRTFLKSIIEAGCKIEGTQNRSGTLVESG